MIILADLSERLDSCCTGGHHVYHRIFPSKVVQHLRAFYHHMRRSCNIEQRGLAVTCLMLSFVPHLRTKPDAFFEPVKRGCGEILVILEQLEASHPCLVAD